MKSFKNTGHKKRQNQYFSLCFKLKPPEQKFLLFVLFAFLSLGSCEVQWVPTDIPVTNPKSLKFLIELMMDVVSKP